MNRLLSMADNEEKTVASKDMLFATLDTQHRRITLEQGNEFILIDTVGFVSKLPHGLVEAFKSTLEEVKYADLLIHVVDSSYAERDFQIEVTNRVLGQIGAGSKEKLMAYNKIDLADEMPIDVSGNDAVYVSARTGRNMNELLAAVKNSLFGKRIHARFVIPYDKGGVTSYLCENGEITSMQYEAEGTVLEGNFEVADYEKYKSFTVA